MERVEKPTSTGTLERGFVRDGRAKEKNKKKPEPWRRRRRRRRRRRDIWVETRRRRRPGARHPFLWLFSTGRRTEKRPKMEKCCGAWLSRGFFALFRRTRRTYILAALCRKMKLIDNFLKTVLVNLSRYGGGLSLSKI